MQTMHNDTLESLQTRAGLLERAERLLDGKIACVCVNRAESEAEGIGYEDIHPISGILRDCEDIELGFTMYEEEENRWRCSLDLTESGLMLMTSEEIRWWWTCRGGWSSQADK